MKKALVAKILALASLFSALLLLQCGTTTSTSGTETHWLERCEDDDECGGFDCVCGYCTLPCANTEDCADAPQSSVCGSPTLAEDPDQCGNDVVGFCLAPDLLPGSGGTGGGGGGDGGVGGFDESEGLFVCSDVPNACDAGDCFELCGVDVAILEPPVISGFTVTEPTGPAGPRIPVGNVWVEERGASVFVYDTEDAEPVGRLVYPGLVGPIVLGEKAFMVDQNGNYLRLDLSDPNEPRFDQFWAIAMDFSNPEIPTPRARTWPSSGEQLVFRVDQSLSFVDVSGDDPVETECLEVPPLDGDPGAIVFLGDEVVVQQVAVEGDGEVYAFRVFDRQDTEEPRATVTTLWESPAYFWQNRMVVYTDEDTPRLALFELTNEGAEELGRADFPAGASPYIWSGRMFAGLLVLEDACDDASCPAFDMSGDVPLAAYDVEAGVVDGTLCVGQATAVEGEDFWLSPRLFPDQRFASEPDHDCGPLDQARKNFHAVAWSPDGSEVLWIGNDGDTPWLGIGDPSGEDITRFSVGEEEWFAGVWWSGDTIVVHSGITCDAWVDWLYLHDRAEPDAEPVRVDFPGPMIQMAVYDGRVWALGLEGSYDCALGNQPELPKRLWRLDVDDPEAGFETFDLPDGADPEYLRLSADTVWLVGRTRTDAVDRDGVTIASYSLRVPYSPTMHASESGLLIRASDGVVHYLEPGSEATPGEARACSEHFPFGSDSDYFYILAREPGGRHLSSPETLQRVRLVPSGDDFSFETEATLPWGGELGEMPEARISPSGSISLLLGDGPTLIE